MDRNVLKNETSCFQLLHFSHEAPKSPLSCKCKLAALSSQGLQSYPQPPLWDIFCLWRHHSYYSSQIIIMPSPIEDTDIWSRLINGAQSNKRRRHKKQVLSSALKQCNNLEPLTSWPKINYEFQDDLTKKFNFFFPLAKVICFHRKYQFCCNHKCLSNHFDEKVSNQCESLVTWKCTLKQRTF